MGCGASKQDAGKVEDQKKQESHSEQPKKEAAELPPAKAEEHKPAAAEEHKPAAEEHKPAAAEAHKPAAEEHKPAKAEEHKPAAAEAHKPAAAEEHKKDGAHTHADGKSKRKQAWDAIRARLPRTKSADDKNRRIELWKEFDQNGTGRLSLAEIDAGCKNILHLDDFSSHVSQILIRAFEKANHQGGKRGDGDYVEFLEFRLLLCYVYDFFELSVMFDEVDSSDDGRVSLEEFKKAIPMIKQWGLAIEDAEATFKEVDKDNGGMILFSEFAQWATEKKLDADGDPDNEQ